VDSPLAKPVQVVKTILSLVHQVVLFWMELIVLLEPLPVGQQPFVIRVLLGNTTNKQVKVLVKVAMRENIKTRREKHRATATMIA
jgi:hypothetical protein